MFKKILIANRGEIACRIIKTCKKLNIQTVAVYSEADSQALHTKLADQAFLLGPAPAIESYLNMEKIISIALQTNSEAIHPGYGFLAENADFAQKCLDAGIIFIGPSPKAIQSMAEKNTAKQIMEAANVPTIPGYHGEQQELQFMVEAAKKLGYPVLIKAVAGGGGKGMRVVHEENEFAQALESAKREAQSAFGNNHVMLEKYLQKPRHIEAQIFGDQQGNVVYLFERDCSIQRRHQKILEEAPAPHLEESLRKKIGETAVRAAKAIHYQGAGTIEFLLDENQQFYFMEMNTRLQVEHPVTEMITGFDLVEWQLLVASGKSLPATQDRIKLHGHAIEVRVYAEDPNKNFIPTTGRLLIYQTPEESSHVRVDSGVAEKDSIQVFYDPLIAKLIVWDEDRSKAIDRLRQALNNFQIIGLTSNLSFLLQLSNNAAFIRGELSTDFIASQSTHLFSNQANPHIWVLAALAQTLHSQKNAHTFASQSSDPQSPWFQRDGWWLNLSVPQVLQLSYQNESAKVTIKHIFKDSFEIGIQDQIYQAKANLLENGEVFAEILGKNYRLPTFFSSDQIYLLIEGQQYIFKLFSSNLSHTANNDAASHLISPMPGTIIHMSAVAGNKVNKGDRLLIIEAMKMEHSLYAPNDGVVKEVFFKQGDLINEGVELIRIEAE